MAGGIFEPFSVYNRSKHSKNGIVGGNHMNIGAGKTTLLFADEYREPKMQAAQAAQAAQSEAARGAAVLAAGAESEPASRKGSVGDTPNMVDLSTLSQAEFERLRTTLRKGAPNNRVNF
ncbi:AaceriAEL303Cp [[Ashbya] aceris (nom. inval.)]|nr:AaceriAEL303Cp [[Ashbya] aceris (nom. inval.)]